MLNNNISRSILEFEIEHNIKDNRNSLIIDYNSSIDEPISLCKSIVSSLYLGITNIGTVKRKEELLYNYYIINKKLIAKNSYKNIYELSSLIPGATTVQIIESVILIKTKSIIISFISTICFILPGIIILYIITVFFNIYNSNLPNIRYDKIKNLLLKINKYFKYSFNLSGISLLISYTCEKLKYLSISNFKLGLVLINSILLFFIHNIFYICIILFLSGYLCIINKECEFLIEKVCIDIKDIVNSMTRWSILGTPSLLLIIIIFTCLIVGTFYSKNIDRNLLKFFTLGTFEFIDYSILNYIIVLFNNHKYKIAKELLFSFGLTSALPGHTINLVGVLLIRLFIHNDMRLIEIIKNLLWILLINLFVYLPSFLYCSFFFKLLIILNERTNIQFFIIGIKCSSIGFIISIIPKLLFHIFNDDLFLHWIIKSIIISLCTYLFIKNRFFLGYIISIISTVFFGYLSN